MQQRHLIELNLCDRLKCVLSKLGCIQSALTYDTSDAGTDVCNTVNSEVYQSP